MAVTDAGHRARTYWHGLLAQIHRTDRLLARLASHSTGSHAWPESYKVNTETTLSLNSRSVRGKPSKQRVALPCMATRFPKSVSGSGRQAVQR